MLITPESAVDEVIERMDEYYLAKEDWETIVELGVGDQKDVKLSTATKTSFTKKYVVAYFFPEVLLTTPSQI